MNVTEVGDAFTTALQDPTALGNYTADPTFTDFEVVTPDKSSVRPTRFVNELYPTGYPDPETYPFPNWAIGLAIAGGILVIFVMLCCIVMCCASSEKQDQRHYLVSEDSSSSPNSSKIEIDMCDTTYSTQTTLKRSPPSIRRNAPPAPTSAPPPPPIITPMPNGKVNGKAINDELDANTMNRYTMSAPGQADNIVSEVVDLRGIYIVDNTNYDEFSSPNGAVHVNREEQLTWL